MIDVTVESLADAVVTLLRLTPPPAEAEIDAVLQRMGAAFGASSDTIAATRRLLHARFEIRMDLGDTLTNHDGHLPWLAGRRSEIDPFYWNRYRQLLLKSGWPPLVAATLDRSTDDLLDLLGNPLDESPWARRGLVMGDVQSGKTASYAALMCKAADTKYRMIVLLTGTLENVRRQTQERLDSALIGFDSRDFLSVGGSLGQKRHIGVGLIDGRRDGVVFTSREHDFRKQAASALNISLNSIDAPVLVVTKKNKGVLTRLAAWLRAYNADRDGKIDMPLLLIDDEADNASVNTKQDLRQMTSINEAIRDLLSMFRRSSYVGFTATPFANIFIDPDAKSDWVGDDLFPRDFIHVLEAPTNYVGMDKLFKPADVNEEGELEAAPSITRTIDDADDWLPAGHKSDFEPSDLPETLRTALRAFLITCAIRDIRSEATPRTGGGIHRTMLVNVSHLTAVQNRVADALHLELEVIRQAVRLHGALPAEAAARQSSEVAQLAQTFHDEFADCPESWTDVLAGLHAAIAPVRVQPVNASTGSKSLDYSAADEPPGVRVVAVGGNSLSRGLTLEGLCVSYFLRNSRAYDTLLQMGRWFGYRPGYGDICRLWLTEEAEGWYRHIAEATGELKRDFARMKRRKATPKEFGLRVRTHPDTLLITARNKMATGVDLAVSHDVSVVGRGLESARLYSDSVRNAHNQEQIERLFSGLIRERGEPVESPWGGALLWREVPAEMVAAFLDEFSIHPLNFAFQADSIAAFLREDAASEKRLLRSWTVALPTVGKAAPHKIDSLPGRTILTRQRVVKFNRDDSSLLVSGRSARVGGKADVRHGILPANLPAGVEAEDEIRALMDAPLLLTYFLRGMERAVKTRAETSFRNGLILPALGLHFPGVPDPNAPKRYVRYRLNRVAQKEMFDADLGDDVANEDEGDDDDD